MPKFSGEEFLNGVPTDERAHQLITALENQTRTQEQDDEFNKAILLDPVAFQPGGLVDHAIRILERSLELDTHTLEKIKSMGIALKKLNELRRVFYVNKSTEE